MSNPYDKQVGGDHYSKMKIQPAEFINKNNVEPVDILCGGFPCQDISLAGKGEGLNGKKSGLWWEMHRIISELRPRIAVMENVPAITFRGLDSVLGSLSEIGYDAEWCIISARDFGAPHLRKRWFCVAYPNSERSRQTRNRGTSSEDRSREEILEWRSQNEKSSNPHSPSIQGKRIARGIHEENPNNDIQIQNYWDRFPSQPPLRDRNDGIPNRLARLRALGNAIVPQCSEWIGKQILNSGLLDGVK